MIAKGIRNAKCGYGCSKTGTSGEKVTKFVYLGRDKGGKRDGSRWGGRNYKHGKMEKSVDR